MDNNIKIDEENKLGSVVKYYRKKKKINSQELSKSLGKSGAYISQIENGHNKNPDYNTLLELFRKLGIAEENLEMYLEALGFMSPEKIAAEKAAEEAWIEREIELMNDPDYQKHLLEQAEFMRIQEQHDNYDEMINRKMDEIRKDLDWYYTINPSEFGTVIENLHKLMVSMGDSPDNFRFLVSLFRKDITKFNKDAKEHIISALKEGYEKSNTGWGERPSW
ncbi:MULTISPECIES: helix-turn-helix domain-containing protein [Bacillus amyloliquefaciens group]|uniref:Transcriptional regulator n=1 Tax=Bacillus amyloliquefaciens TaxID=1390 RepID=A0AAP7N9Y4_BACAM|nr:MULTISPECIES: helix-turn-helix transcriptional regulator [Bacillus amyloliquefaciens group]ERH52315.1 iduronate sulfatase [Bacillus amyloliquefaciens EGD-AQ14]KPD35979.1 iduronate sulfatase [Bacillus amyloliquefaciens]OIK22699.1 transcriptional regulator [Bacillus amyloliquefaciens]